MLPQPLPQKQERRRIQINHSQQSLPQPQLSLFLPKRPLPQPQPQLLPPQKNNKRMIIQEQLPPKNPFPLQHAFELFPQPQLVAVKSLIFCCLQVLFMVYSMHGGMSMFPEDLRYFFCCNSVQYMDKGLA